MEHLHYSVGKSVGDESYYESSALIPTDCDAFNAYCVEGLNADIGRIVAGRGFGPVELAAFKADLNIPERWGDPSPWSLRSNSA
jgi:hypothetical protein